MQKNKSQISVLILIALLIITLVIFIITQNQANQKAEIEKDRQRIIAHQNSEVESLKTYIDYCLKKELQKAIITSGLRGGFIYEDLENEYYFPGTIPDNTYTKEFISNQQLNWEYLKKQTLVHSQADVYTPGFESNQFMYTHSIAEDMNKFIEKEFITCLKFKNLEEINNVNYTDYLGTIKTIDYERQEVVITDTIGRIGDTVMIDLNGKSMYGTITSENQEIKEYTVTFESLQYLREENANSLENINTINLNNSLNLTIEYNLENVKAQIEYPVKLEDTDFYYTYKNPNVEVNVRYKELIEFSKILLREKYLNDKNINYSSPEVINQTLQKSSYFKATDKKDLELKTTVLKNTDEEKWYIYSLIDKNSKIIGHPFVLNFGYENTAPFIEYNDDNPNDNTITLRHTPSSTNTYNIKNLAKIYDNQIADNYYHIHFIPQDKTSGTTTFKIDKNGNIEFKASTSNDFLYEFEITDGETKRKYTLKFIP